MDCLCGLTFILMVLLVDLKLLLCTVSVALLLALFNSDDAKQRL